MRPVILAALALLIVDVARAEPGDEAAPPPAEAAPPPAAEAAAPPAEAPIDPAAVPPADGVAAVPEVPVIRRRVVPREKEAEGTQAINRNIKDAVIKSQYRLNGEELEVDPN